MSKKKGKNGTLKTIPVEGNVDGSLQESLFINRQETVSRYSLHRLDRTHPSVDYAQYILQQYKPNKSRKTYTQ